MASISTVTKLLTSPRNIAQRLDWRKVSGSVLSLHVGLKSIDLAVATHPGSDVEPVQALPSVALHKVTRGNQKVLAPEVLTELNEIANELQVCGVIVSWPVQKEGRCGAQCGRVLHILDQIVAGSNDDSIISQNSPVCLWDAHHFGQREDEWGRASEYATPTERTIHYASVEQYQDEGVVAMENAGDFMRHHWPDLWQRNQESVEAAIAMSQADDDLIAPSSSLIRTPASVQRKGLNSPETAKRPNFLFQAHRSNPVQRSEAAM